MAKMTNTTQDQPKNTKRGHKRKRSINTRLKVNYKEFSYGLMIKVFCDIPEGFGITEEDIGKQVFVAGNRHSTVKVWSVDGKGVTVIEDGAYRTYPIQSVICDRKGLGIRFVDETDDPQKKLLKKISTPNKKNSRKDRKTKKVNLKKIDEEIGSSSIEEMLRSQISNTLNT